MDYRERLMSAIGFIVFLLALGTVIYSNIEGWIWYDALFFSASTITTVGYGDLIPHTVGGRLFTILYMLVGVGTALYAFTIVAEHYFEEHLPAQRGSVRSRINRIKAHAASRKASFRKGLLSRDDRGSGDDREDTTPRQPHRKV